MGAMIDLAPPRASGEPGTEAEPASGPLVASIARLSFREAIEQLPPNCVRGVRDVLDFLFRPRDLTPNVKLIETLCQLLIDAGVPLDRYGSTTSMVTAEHDAVGRLWRRGEGVEQIVYVSPEEGDVDYLVSPYRLAAETMQWVEMWLPTTRDDRFGIVASLKKQGYVHYLCVPVLLTNKEHGWVTFATKHPAGFSRDNLLTLAVLMPPLAGRIDSGVGWTTLDKLLRTYVGDEPHTAILAGRAKRGQVTTIEAAMLVADLRDSTGHTARLGIVEAVGLFNDLFDGLVPAIEVRRGEVLKYLGDGLLAMFRDTDYGGSACDRALDAAEAALAAIDAHNRAHPDRRPMEVGIALHHGEIAYGNIGSGSRLDFTVIGRDVALATRIAGMNGMLGEPLLLSGPFALRASRPAQRVGAYAARGFEEPVEVFRPAPRSDDTDHRP